MGQAERDYPLLHVDLGIELACTYYQHGHLGDAIHCLEYAEQAIPDAYRIKVSSQLSSVPPEECIERHWRQMGEIERLRARITNDPQHDVIFFPCFECFCFERLRSGIKPGPHLLEILRRLSILERRQRF